MKLKTTILAAALLTFAGTANAQSVRDDSGVYVMVGLENIDSDGIDLQNAVARVGFDINKYFAVEGEARIGLDGETIAFGTQTVDVELDQGFAGYALARFPIDDEFSIFGRVGYHTTEVNIADSVDGVAWGGGVQVNFATDSRYGLRAGYTRLEAEDDGDGDVWSASLFAKF